MLKNRSRYIVRLGVTLVLVLLLIFMATPVAAADSSPEEYGALILTYIGLFFADARVQTILGLIIAEVFLAVAAAIKNKKFEWQKIGDFYLTMVVPYILGFLGFYLAGKFIDIALIAPYDDVVGEGTIGVAWLALVINLVADIIAKAKELGIPLPKLPGFNEGSE